MIGVSKQASLFVSFDYSHFRYIVLLCYDKGKQNFEDFVRAKFVWERANMQIFLHLSSLVIGSPR